MFEVPLTSFERDDVHSKNCDEEIKRIGHFFAKT